MSNENDRDSETPKTPSRRGFLTAAGIAFAGTTLGAGAASEARAATGDQATTGNAAAEPFWGEHQGGILTRPQSHTYFAAFDLTTDKRDDVITLLKTWTQAAARMSKGLPIEPFKESEIAPPTDMSTTTTVTTADYADAKPTLVALTDSSESLELPPARLTVTFGFGAGLFVKDGEDRFGLAKHRPEAFVDLPRFVGDQLVEAHTGGDLSVQACADDPQVAFHAVRQLARLAYDFAGIRWTQSGFIPNFGPKRTPRNLMGFKDGTNNPSVADAEAMAKIVWVGEEGPDWMRGGSYLVARRIRIAIEHWDRTNVPFQEQTVGRHKLSGAPLGKAHEFDAADYGATDKDGNSVIPENAHIRLAAPVNNDGAQILRRPYSFNDGVNFTAERWPPWRQGNEYDAGLFFLAYQRDARTGFIKIFDRMAKFDMMNQFVTHVGGGFFAIPRGAKEGEYIGQKLFEST
ncbi:MAG TPA: Dyp-type peroxidase [Stellaceae bacterium]|nr:Dyp-type peroxidase [Stellaceae bacterium]